MNSISDQLEQAQQALGEAAEFVLNDLRQKWKEISGGPSVIEGLKAFAAAVDWTEKWIIALLSVHGLLFLTAVASRNRSWVQGAIFSLCMLLIYNAERLNTLARTHWKSFAGQNYFDPQGIFASALLSAPLLLTMFAILVNYLVQTSVLLVKMKRRELAYKARQRQRQQGQAGGSAAREGKKDK